MNSPRVNIVILNYKTWEDTLECLESIYRLNYDNYKVIVVDNDSPNESVNKIQDWAEGEYSLKVENRFFLFSKEEVKKTIRYQILSEADSTGYEGYDLTLIKANQNNGYSAGNNIGLRFGMKHSKEAFFWILNNDVVVEPESLGQLVDFYIKNPAKNIGIVGSKVMYYHDPKLIQCAGGASFNKYFTTSKQIGGDEIDHGQWNKKVDNLGIISGACSFLQSDFIEDVGLLSEDYFLYFEEMDWAQRAFKKGWQLDYCYHSTVYHKEGSTTGGGNKKHNNGVSFFADFYFNRNRLIFSFKHNNLLGILSTYIMMLAVILNRIRKFQFKRAVVFTKLLFYPYQNFNYK